MAFRSRRRTGARGAWFPTQSNFQFANFTAGPTAGAAGHEVAYGAIPIIAAGFDEPINTDTLTAGTQTAGWLSSATRQAYTVKRVVGSIFANVLGSQTAVLFAGLVKDTVSPVGGLANIGAWNPFAENSVQRRWMFRRMWFLSGSASQGWPRANVMYGSVREGAHVDIKVKARVEPLERLFLIYGVQNPSGTPAAVSGEFFWNLRMFANMYQGGNR